jgi:hypothetical protein
LIAYLVLVEFLAVWGHLLLVLDFESASLPFNRTNWSGRLSAFGALTENALPL